eukprot:1352324-Amphidinium_carterae.1
MDACRASFRALSEDLQNRHRKVFGVNVFGDHSVVIAVRNGKSGTRAMVHRLPSIGSCLGR